MTDERDIERAEAETLRRALEGEAESEAVELLDLVGRIQAVSGLTPPLEAEARDRAIEAALDRISQPAPVAEVLGAPPPRRRWQRWAAMALAAGLAAAVVGSLIVGRPHISTTTLPDEAYAAPTDQLFDGPFPEDQTAAERADLILAARTRGYFAGLAAERGLAVGDRGDRDPAPAQVALLGKGIEP